MITFQEAYKKLLKQFPQKEARKYVDYNGYYIFLLTNKDAFSSLDSMYAVNKETGVIGAYQPTNDKNAKEFFKLWNKK